VRTNHILNSEENLKLENRYSDSYFYKNPENIQDNPVKPAGNENRTVGEYSLDNKHKSNNRTNYIPYDWKY
jgi:hypothetical protein